MYNAKVKKIWYIICGNRNNALTIYMELREKDIPGIQCSVLYKYYLQIIILLQFFRQQSIIMDKNLFTASSPQSLAEPMKPVQVKRDFYFLIIISFLRRQKSLAVSVGHENM
jgi:hypothetical protein